MKMHRSAFLVSMLLIVFAAGAAHAKSNRVYLAGGYTVASFPMGDWGKIAGFGLGIDATNLTLPSEGSVFAIRSNVGFVYNFSRTEEVPLANLGPSSALALETKNGTFYFGIGPEFGKTTGPIDPFVFGTVGFNTYWTESDMFGTAGGEPYSSKFGDSRIAFAWGAGGGLRKHVTAGGTVELSVEYRSGPGHMYVLPEEVTNTGTTVNVERKARTTDQILVRLGTTLGY